MRLSIVTSSPKRCGGGARDDDGNSGDGKTGNGKTDDVNSGDGNSGDGNSGDGNSSDDNSGDGNLGDGNSSTGGNAGGSGGCDVVEREFEPCDSDVASVSVEALIEAFKLARIA